MCFLIALFATSQTANACELATSDRAIENAAYVENGINCLQNLPDGYTLELGLEADFIELINKERRAEGLQPLALRTELVDAARFHSLDMVYNGYFGHDSPSGRKPSDRIAAFDRTLIAQFTAENVASEARSCTNGFGMTVSCSPTKSRPASATLAHLHQGLMDSPGHRANILSKKATHVALGVVRHGDDIFVTQLFADPAGELSQPAPLRYEAGTSLTLETDLPEWSEARFAVIQDDIQIDLENGELPASLSGDFALQVRGENKSAPVQRGNQIVQSCEFIELPGPIITVVPPTGS
ncbi:MAG: CAP domain-containing protein [Henriciella sp.]|nr:CAP domain-containing protein [Henriciella sp.]